MNDTSINIKKQFYTAKELSNALNIPISRCRLIIKECNERLESKGFYVIPNRAPTKTIEEILNVTLQG